MRRILPLELVGKTKLDFDLFDEKGVLLYKNGDELTPGIIMQLNYKKVFANEEKAPDVTTEGPAIIIPVTLTEQNSIISEKATKILVNNTKTILKKAYENEKPDLTSCKDAADIIIEEVSNKLDKVECISQLRIFDEYTFSHTVNVSTMASALGVILELGEDRVKELALGALLHDIGKMRVPKDILNKPAKLEPDEFTIMKSHTILGYKYIKEYLDVSEEIAKVALDHQEKYSGNGYPNNLKGKEISFYAQITSIADVFDALISNRVYKKAMEQEKAIDIMVSESNKSFNPYMLSRFLKLTGFEHKADIIVF